MHSARHEQTRREATAWAQVMQRHNAIILDFETTGLKDSEIVQIGVIDLQGGVLMDSLVKPMLPIPPEVTRVHGITDAHVQHAPSFPQLYVQLSVLLAGKIVIAYNVAFDKGILEGVCRRHKLPQMRPAGWECAMQNYARFWGQWDDSRRSYKWQSLANAARQQNVIVPDHSAVKDCQTTLALLRIMAGI